MIRKEDLSRENNSNLKLFPRDYLCNFVDDMEKKERSCTI